jgi:hypothetical protein
MTGTIKRTAGKHPDEIEWTFEPQRFDSQPKRSTGWRTGVPQLPKDSDTALYVDAAKGSDAAAGSLSAPLKTIGAAVKKASGGGTIYLRAGIFHLTETVEIMHSGITIQPYQGVNGQSEEVTVSGGVVLRPNWKKVPSLATTSGSTDAYDTYASSVPQGLSFLELFNGSTARLIPARNPNGNPEVDRNNFKYGGKATSCKDFGEPDAVIVNASCAGCVDNRKGYFSTYTMGVGGRANNFVPAISYWAQVLCV